MYRWTRRDIWIYTFICGLYICIPCKNCKLKHIGETSRQLQVRLKKHKRDIRIGYLNNALFQRISQSNHNFDFNSAKMLIYIHNKRLRRIFEADDISLCNSLNTRPGFYNISPFLSKSILNRYNIFHLKFFFFLSFFFFFLFLLFLYLFLPPFDLKSLSINKRNMISTQYF